MIIEILGGGFYNKGAELMLRATVFEIGTRLPHATFAVDESCATRGQIRTMGLRRITPPRGNLGSLDFNRQFWGQKRFDITKKVSCLNPLSRDTRLSSCGAILDISGFAYSDRWGSRRIQNFGALSRYYKVRQCPVILLPQTLGPFQKKKSRNAFRKVYENADIIYARDQLSYQYVTELCRDHTKLRMAPDITFFYPDVGQDENGHCSDYVCLVPNARMLDFGRYEWRGKYGPLLINIAREVISLGLKVKVLIHELCGKDQKIAKRIIRSVSSPHISLENEGDPLGIKKIIRSCRFLIGSRYHSLVGALAACVPAIGLGWAHKYSGLFMDFGIQDLLVQSDTPIEKVVSTIREISSIDGNLSYRRKIKNRLDNVKIERSEMWNTVSKILTR